ncbi:MAG: glutamine synthetase family protein [candidate division WOR-3 bacterium]
MTKKQMAQVKQQVAAENVKFVQLWFTDVLGSLKGLALPVNELTRALESGMSFDGSSIQGFARIEEADMVARPDPSTFAVLPWEPNGQKVARMFCDIQLPDGRDFDGDPRLVLKRNLTRARALGYDFLVGTELEFFYFKGARTPELLDSGGYFDLATLDTAQSVRHQTISALESVGIGVEYSHHEVSASQHEIDLRYTGALEMADNVMTAKTLIKEVAQRQGLHASFMPKPKFGINGSGMHIHMSLFRRGRNAFYDPKDQAHLSALARSFVAGLLRHAPELTLVTNQWVNSYKRLTPGFEAPVYVSWARMNRSALVRIPAYKPGRESSARLEYRAPDPGCNPYLAFAVLLAAGLAGIEGKYELPQEASDNIFRLSSDELALAGIKTLPGDLAEAIALTQASDLVQQALGRSVFDYLMRNKQMEWDDYRTQVTEYEIRRYLPVL